MKMWGLIILFVLMVFNNVIAGELEERATINQQIATLLNNSDYKMLEQMGQEYRMKKSRTPSGLWKLTLFYYAIHNVANIEIKEEEFWSSLKSKTANWTREYPHSPTACIAHGIVLQRYAWKFRGGGFAYDVPQEGWEPFYKNLNSAKAFLEKNKQTASIDPH